MAHSAPLVGSSIFNENENFTDYSIAKDVQRQGGGAYWPSRPAELPSPMPVSLDFKNHAFELPSPMSKSLGFKSQAFELPTVSPTLPKKHFTHEGSRSDQENVMSWDTYH